MNMPAELQITINVFNEREAFAVYKQNVEDRYRGLFPLSGDPKRGLTYNELHQLFPDASESYQLSSANTFIERIRRMDPNMPFADAVRKAAEESSQSELSSIPRSMKADLLTVMDIPPSSSPEYQRDLDLRKKVQSTLEHGYFTPETFNKEWDVANKIKESVQKNEFLRDGLQHFDALSLDQKKEVISAYTDVVSHAYGIPSPKIHYVDSYKDLQGSNEDSVAQLGRGIPSFFGKGGLLIHNGDYVMILRTDQLDLNQALIAVPHEIEHAVQVQMVREQLLYPNFVTPENIQARLLVASLSPAFVRSNDNSNYISVGQDKEGYQDNTNEMYSYRASILAVQGALAGIGDEHLIQTVKSDPEISGTLSRLKFDAQENDREIVQRKKLTAFLKGNGNKDVNLESLHEMAFTYNNNVNEYQEMVEAAKKGVKGMQSFLVKHGYELEDNDPVKTFQHEKEETSKLIREQWQGGNPADGKNLVQEAKFLHVDIGNLPSPDQVLRDQSQTDKPQQQQR